MNEFVDYVMDFYGYNGIYDIQATRKEVIAATNKRLEFKQPPFEGDSIDREMVRDIILEMRAA